MEYTLGLDIGTNSLGWCVIDENDNIVRKEGHHLWGVRLFEESKTAQKRRTYRNARRRLKRRKERLSLLQDIFKIEMSKTDPHFFDRLNESFFINEDRTENGKPVTLSNYLFNNITDKEFYDKYPTIWHLREDLVVNKNKADIRYIYLAMHHIMKYRGNFLKDGASFSDEININLVDSLKAFYNKYLDTKNSLISWAKDSEDDYYIENEKEYEKLFPEIDESSVINQQLVNILLDKQLSKRDRKNNVLEVIPFKDSLLYKILTNAILYRKYSFKDFKKIIFDCDEVNSKDFLKEVSFDDENFENIIRDNYGSISSIYPLIEFASDAKQLADDFYLSDLLNGEQYLSSAFTKRYESHKKELKELKRFVKEYYTSETYKNIFRRVKNPKEKDKYLPNYASYIGLDGKSNFSHCKKEDFYNYLICYGDKKNKGILDLESNLIKEKDEKYEEIISSIRKKVENDEYLLRINSGANGTIPYQIHLKELEAIIANQSIYYPFLNELVDGKNKIISIFTFKRPYYIGPLKSESEFSWVDSSQFKVNEKLYPWNFLNSLKTDDIAEKFIERMQNKCTYLKGENDFTLPKESIYLQEFNCLQYLNKIKINGNLIDLSLRDEIFDELFKKQKKVNKSDISKYIKNHYSDEADIGISDCNVSYSSYVTFKDIVGEQFLNDHLNDIIEPLIKDITIFEDKDILEKRINKRFGNKLDSDQIKKIKGLNYNKFGRLCKRLLIGPIVNNETGEVFEGVLPILRSTNKNFMEILNSPDYDLVNIISNYNRENTELSNEYEDEDDKLNDFLEKNLVVSPLWKRSFIQTYRIIEELEDILKKPISYYSIECTRNHEESKQKDSRYQSVKKLLDELEKEKKDKEYREVYERFESFKNEPSKLKSDKYYLYFTQLGIDLYTGKHIDFDDLEKGKVYDIDHIYPQSKIKDDSLKRNKVLVEKNINNAIKGNKFLCDIPRSDSFRPKRLDVFYKLLCDKKFIKREKYERLTEKEKNKDKLNSFVDRQLVSTNQSVIALTTFLRDYKGVPNSHIIYSKADNVSHFRHEYGIFKSREANNFHHAHDAYLNAVIGKYLENYYRQHHFYNINDLETKEVTINPINILRYKFGYLKSNSYIDKRIDELKTKISNKEITKSELSNIDKIYYNVFANFDIRETERIYFASELIKQVTIMNKGEGTYPVKKFTPNNNLLSIDNYGGYKQPSYYGYVVVRSIDKKGNTSYKLVGVRRDLISDDEAKTEKNIMRYLKEEKGFDNVKFGVKKYNDKFLILGKNIVLKQNDQEFKITGVGGGGFLLENNRDRVFNRNEIYFIHKLFKFNENLKYDSYIPYKTNFNEINDLKDYAIILHKSKDKKEDDIILSIKEIKEFLNKFQNKLVKNYNCSQSKKISSLVLSNLNYFDAPLGNNEIDTYKHFLNCVKCVKQALKFMKTNERATFDLSFISGSKNDGMLSFSGTFNKGDKLIAYSPTGLRRKVLFEAK